MWSKREQPGEQQPSHTHTHKTHHADTEREETRQLLKMNPSDSFQDGSSLSLHEAFCEPVCVCALLFCFKESHQRNAVHAHGTHKILGSSSSWSSSSSSWRGRRHRALRKQFKRCTQSSWSRWRWARSSTRPCIEREQKKRTPREIRCTGPPVSRP